MELREKATLLAQSDGRRSVGARKARKHVSHGVSYNWLSSLYNPRKK